LTGSVSNNTIAIGKSAGIGVTGAVNSNTTLSGNWGNSHMWGNSSVQSWDQTYAQTQYTFEVKGDDAGYLPNAEQFGFLCTNIIGDQVIFKTDTIDKRNEPLETIFRLMNNKVKLNVNIIRQSYELLIEDLQFTEIVDLYSTQSATTLSVKFTKNDSINYENTLLSITEKRHSKIEAIKKKLKKGGR